MSSGDNVRQYKNNVCFSTAQVAHRLVLLTQRDICETNVHTYIMSLIQM